MKKYIVLGLSSILFISCEDVIDISVKDGVSQLVVDAWITDANTEQKVVLTNSQAFFDNSPAKPVLGATVIVFDEDSLAYPFVDLKNNGVYTYTPKNGKSFNQIGKRYALYIKNGSEEYYSISQLNRVPKIDSVSYQEFKFPVAPPDSTPQEGYLAEFYANDAKGEGDCYWVKYGKNSKLANKATQIVIAYDAGFSPGSKSDNLMFIKPIRQSVNGLGLFEDKDTLNASLYSITPEAYYYLLQVRQETTNGGIFATPPANIPTNILNRNANSKNKAIGFFAMSAVSNVQTIVDKSKAKPKDN